jgi:protein O-mannosyl-transferase
MRNKISERGIAAAICVVLIALVWFVFGQTIRFPFINFDDPEYVYEVPEINQGMNAHDIVWAFTRVPSPIWSPLTNLSHMIEAQIYGMNAGGYHLTNVVLHSIGAVLVFLVLLQATGALWRAAFVAAFFAIHPLRAESVAWITERKDVLSGVFFMLTLWAYIIYARKPGVLRYCLVFVAFACGLMSKPMLVTTPVLLLLLDYWPLRRATELREWWKLLVEKTPLLALSALSCVATIVTQTVAESSFVPPSLLSRTKNAVVSVIIYIRQTLWPTDLSVFYPHPRDNLDNWLALVAALLVLGMTGLALIVRRKHPYFVVGWFWYLLMLTPVLGIVQAGRQAHADRFIYLPQIGLGLLVTWTIADWTTGWWKRREVLAIAGAIALIALALVARTQTSYWRDSELLWSHAIAVTKNNAFAHASLADLLLRRGRLDEAILHCQEALKIDPRDADAHNNLGLALLQKGHENEAAAEFRKSLEIDPHQMNAAPNLAWILATSPDPATRDGPKAVELTERVLQHAGHPNAIVLRTLAAAYAESGRFSDAINAAEQASQIAVAQGNFGLAEDLQRCIENYRVGRPLRSYVGAQ